MCNLTETEKAYLKCIIPDMGYEIDTSILDFKTEIHMWTKNSPRVYYTKSIEYPYDFFDLCNIIEHMAEEIRKDAKKCLNG